MVRSHLIVLPLLRLHFSIDRVKRISLMLFSSCNKLLARTRTCSEMLSVYPSMHAYAGRYASEIVVIQSSSNKNHPGTLLQPTDEKLKTLCISPIISTSTRAILESVKASSVTNNNFPLINLRNEFNRCMTVSTYS